MAIPSTITMLFTIYLVFHTCYTYSTSNEFVYFLADTGRMAFVSITDTYVYNITFSQEFNYTPTVVIALASVQFCTFDTRESFDLIGNRVISKTGAQISMSWLNSASITNLQINYFAFDKDRIGYFRYYETTLKIRDSYSGGSDQDTQEINVDFNVTENKVKILCFLGRIAGVQQFGDKYKQSVVCSKKDNKTIQITVRNQEQFSGLETDSYHGNVRDVKRFDIGTLVIFDRDAIDLQYGTLEGTNSLASTKIAFGTKSDLQFIMIGLRDFEIDGRCFDFGVSATNKQIVAGSFDKIRFDYFTVVKKGGEFAYLNDIYMDFYSTQFKLNYQNLTNNMTSVSKSSYKLSSTDDIEVIGEISTGLPDVFIKCRMKRAMRNTDIQITYMYAFATKYFEKKTVFRVVTITGIAINYHDCTVKVKVINARTTNFTFTTNYLTLVSITQSGQDAVLLFLYSNLVFGMSQRMFYNDYNGYGDLVYLDFIVPKFTEMETSVKDNKAKLKFQNMKKLASTSQFKLTKSTDFAKNLKADKNGDKVTLEFNYEGLEDTKGGVFSLDYVWNDTTGYYINFSEMELMTAVHLLHTKIANRYELTLINLYKAEGVQLSQFTSSQTGVGFKEVKLNGPDIILTLDIDPSAVGGNQYEITFSLSTVYSVVIKNIQTIPRFKNFSSTQYKNNLDIYLENPSSLTQSTLPTITTNNPHVTFKSVSIADDNTIYIEATYNYTVDGKELEFNYSEGTDALYFETFSTILNYQFALVFCVGDLDSLSKLYYTLAEVVQYSYLGLFVVAVLFMNKLAGVEMMFLIQFAYYSLIIIGVYCPYVGLANMKYVSGYNPLFSDIQQQTTKYNLSDLGIRSNFLSNVNVMIFVLGVCPVLFGVLTLLGNKSECYKMKPRYLKYGKAFICEVPLTILIFSSFNVYTSLIVQIQYYDSQSMIPLATAIMVSLLLPAYSAVYFFFNNHFSQFREEFETIQKIGPFSRQISMKIRQAYPLILIAEFIIFPLLLSINAISSFSLYIALVLVLAVSAYTMVATPYLHKIDNLRLLIHRILLVLLVGCQIVFKILADQGVDDGGFIFYIPMVLLGLLALGLLVDGANIIRVSIIWVRKRGIIDHALKMAKQSTRIKPVQPHLQTLENHGQEKWYPKLQFGQYKKDHMKAIRRTTHSKVGFIMQENLLGRQEDDS